MYKQGDGQLTPPDRTVFILKMSLVKREYYNSISLQYLTAKENAYVLGKIHS